jgi:hypothetical protein
MAATTEQNLRIAFLALISRIRRLSSLRLTFNMISMELGLAALLKNSFSSAAFPS